MCWNSGIDPTPCSGGAAAVEGRSRSRGQPSMIEGFPSPWCTQGVGLLAVASAGRRDPCRAVSPDLRSHVIACRAVPTPPGWRAPDSLRPDGGPSAISSTWRSPITLRSEGNSSPF